MIIGHTSSLTHCSVNDRHNNHNRGYNCWNAGWDQDSHRLIAKWSDGFIELKCDAFGLDGQGHPNMIC